MCWDFFGARKGGRTLTPFGNRPLNDRVCHSAILAKGVVIFSNYEIKYNPNFQFCLVFFEKILKINSLT